MGFEIIHNEKELLLQVSLGDRNAFRELYGHYFPVVQGYVRLFVSSKSSLDELTQDVFVRIWDKQSKLAGIASFKGYLFMVTRNVVIDHFRFLKMQQRLGDLESSEMASGSDSEKELLFKQYYGMVWEAVEKLPTSRRKIFKMSIEQGMSLDEIARDLDITRAGVKKQLYAATAFVRQYLQDHGEMSLLLFLFLSLLDR